MSCRNVRPAALKRKGDQHGFTLIELMIALVLGIFVIIAVSSIFLSGRQAYGTTQGLNRIQENQRMAFEMMAADIRSAGSYACPGLMDPIWLVGNNGDDWPETRYILAVGLEGNSPLVSSQGAQHKQGFDSITLAMDSAIGAISAGADRQYYPIGEHKKPTDSIKLWHNNAPHLNRSAPNYVAACNVDVAMVFATSSSLAGNDIPVTGLCGVAFTRQPPEGLDCSSKEPPAKGYCFWGKLDKQPDDTQKQTCGEWATSQGFVVNLADYKPASDYSNAWYVDNSDDKGILLNWARGGIIAEGVTGLELRYRLRGEKDYLTAEEIQIQYDSSTFDFAQRRGVGKGTSPPASSHKFLSVWKDVEVVHLKIKFKTPDNTKGADGKLLERTMETYITVRSHKLEY